MSKGVEDKRFACVHLHSTTKHLEYLRRVASAGTGAKYSFSGSFRSRDRSFIRFEQDVLGAVRSQARRPDREGSEGARAGQREADGDAALSGGLGSQPHATNPTLEKRFSSMANLAEAEDGVVDAMDGPSTGSVRDTSSAFLGASAGNPGCVAADGTVSSDEAGSAGDQPHEREGVEAVSVGCPSGVEQDQPPHFPALRRVGTEKQKARREKSAPESGSPPSRPSPSEAEPADDPSPKPSAGSSVNVADTEDVAARRIQATSRRRAAQNAASNKRNKRPATGETKARPPVHGGAGSGCGRATTCPQRGTTQQVPTQRGSEERGEGWEEERAPSLLHKTHRQAAEIRRERAEREQCLQDQQFLFGPGFQQQKPRTSLTKRDSGGKSGKSSSGSEGQSRCRDAASLTPSEEDRRQTRDSRAAIKIQSQVRRKAASRRVAAARQGRIVAPAAVSMPKLPIDSLVHRQASAARRAAQKVQQREPLAILRQLRSEDSKAALGKPKTDQFRLRLTIKSAIEAHIRKTGAARRKPRPLPTPPSWRHHNMASMKAKTWQQQGATTRVRLAKPRPISPLHRTVRQVNTLVAAHKLRGHAAEGPGRGPGGRRARSAPTRATDRLRCAIFAAETMVEREYARAEKRQSFGGTGAPVEELSEDLLASPLLVPFQPVA